MTKLPRFTPSNLPPAVLHRLFVGRHQLLNQIGRRITAAIGTRERIHTLIVGPRGAGKTHLVSLVVDHVATLRDQGQPVQAAWLLEDPYLIGSYEDLLREIAGALNVSVPRAADRAEAEATLTTAFGRDGLIVVVIENLDEVFDALGKEGQHHLRHYVQSEATMLLVATTTAVSRDLSDEAWPFFGFFTTDHLLPFTTDEAAEMLRRIAVEDGNAEVAQYLSTPEARGRLRAIEHLVGGQPRIWAILSSALTVSGLRQLVDLLLGELDALTPYYQEQMRRLSPLQRRTVAALIKGESALTVSDLAAAVGVEQRSMAKVLSELRDRNWVTVAASPFTEWIDRRRSYYELAEPLARIAFQIKGARATPIATIVDFVKMWFDPDLINREDSMFDELYLEAIQRSFTSDAVGSVVRSLRALPIHRVPTLGVLEQLDDVAHALTERDPEPLLALPTPLRLAIEDRVGAPTKDGFDERLLAFRSQLAALALNELGDIPDPRTTDWICRMERWLHSAGERGPALLGLARLFGKLWRFDEVEQTISALERTHGSSSLLTLNARYNLGQSLLHAGRAIDAVEVLEKVLLDTAEILGETHEHTRSIRTTLGSSYFWAGYIDTASAMFERVLDDWVLHSGEARPETLIARNNLALTYQAAGRTTEAIALLEQTLTDSIQTLGETHPNTLTFRQLLEQWRHDGIEDK